jgi:surface carbohydrate biosynthesis protein
MSLSKRPLILPVETHVRELDGKLLLAAVAAEAGREVILGSQNEIRAKIGRLPQGFFIAKGFASQKAKFMDILTQLGFTILAWDEEGLVHHAPEIYYKRRISSESLAYLRGVFSWGPDYTKLFSEMPFYDGTPIYETGNPRIDLLDARVREYFRTEALSRRTEHGSYILLNSNFGRVNSAVKRSRDNGVAGKPTDPELDKKWHADTEHRRQLYHHFRDMFEAVAKAFPERRVILRPHPSERIESWADISERCPNARVIYEGNVLPWLLGAEALVHNGCMTAIESTLMDKPAICFQPIASAELDWHLPNSISHQAQGVDALIMMLRRHIDGAAPLMVTADQHRLLDRFVHSDPQRLACDLIVAQLEAIEQKPKGSAPATSRLKGRMRAAVRAAGKKLRSLRRNDIYSPWHQDKHFPDFTLEEMFARLERLRQATGRFAGVRVEKTGYKLFRLTPSP